MSDYNYHIWSAVLFLAAAVLHTTRVLKQWDLALGTYLIPQWVSVLLVVITLSLAWYSISLMGKKRRKK